MHKTRGQRDPALAFPLASERDDADERRQANRAIAVSAVGLAVTGLAELLLAILTGSVGLLDRYGRGRRGVGARCHRLVADEVARQLPEAGSFTWTTRAAPV
jgi:hypothetical protein